MANYKPVVFLPGFSGKVTENVHTLITTTKDNLINAVTKLKAGTLARK